MKTPEFSTTCLSTFFLFALAASIHAQSNIITPTGATSSTTIGGSRTIVQTINSSDLSGGGTSGDILSETHDLTTDSAGYWLSGNGAGNATTEVITYTLAEASTVDAVHFWQYNRRGDNPGRAIKTFDISFSTDNGATFPTIITGATLGDFLYNQNGMPSVDGEIPVQSKTFATQTGVTHIRLTNITNYGNAYLGFSEIRFGTPAAAGNDYSDWIADYPEVGAETGLDDDPDGDGIENGVENFFGTLPDEFSQGLVSGTVDTGAGTFRFTHPQGTLADDLTATYRWSTDLATFQANGVESGGTTVSFTTEADTPEAGTTRVTATVTGTAVDRLFVDVEVNQN